MKKNLFILILNKTNLKINFYLKKNQKKPKKKKNKNKKNKNFKPS